MAGLKKNKKNDIAGVLPRLLRDNGWEKQIDLHSIFPNWRKLVGDEICEHAQPLKIERGVLWIEVENSSWLQQFQYEKLDLLDNLNRFLKLSTLNDIKMVLPKGETWKKVEKPLKKVSFVRPTAEKVTAFQQQVECIADEKCREALMQFWYLAEACKREKE
ncbi:MAG: hypothetical protein VR65_16370 [Desulfobulbaceae bacterium BRH_c16a]|nr:MAG: hypothetical protein VR65_16370 [Desulfobulbaceae bacterium BRH_c16a]